MASETPTVGFVVDDLGYGGAQKQLVLLARALPPRFARRVYVLSSIDAPHGSTLRADGIAVTTWPRRSGLDVGRFRALARALGADRVDIVHGFLDAANVYAYLAGRLRGKPIVLSLRNERLMLTGARARVLEWMLRRADAVTVNSEAGRAFLVGTLGVDRARAHYVPNVAPVVARAQDPVPGLIGCVGRLVDQKRIDSVLHALPLVRAKIPLACLELIGDGPNRDALRSLAGRLGVSGAVEFVGAVDNAAERIARLSCLALPSAFEGLPNAALEAVSAGVPVVASPVGDVPSIVVDGKTGVVVRDVSPQPLADAIVRALTDGALRARAQNEGPRLVRERFSQEAALRVMVPLYDTLSKRTGAAAFEATTPVLGE
ncbi:MAG: glycosyltransferase family 4 protein [Candidatus Latescibacteria bacterium]|nr:glycosyltransferase family 4 protein [Candidatus Latescibacterota bacterium]